MRDARDQDIDTGVSPGTWAILATVLAVISFFQLFSSGRISAFLTQSSTVAIEEYGWTDASWALPALLLGLGTVLAIVGMRLRTVLRSWGDRSGLPDVAGAGGVLAGTGMTVAGALSWVALLINDVTYDDANIEETFYLVMAGLWAQALTVGLGLMCLGTAWSLRSTDTVGRVVGGLGIAAGLVALLSLGLMVVLDVGMTVAIVGQAVCLIWIATMPREAY